MNIGIMLVTGSSMVDTLKTVDAMSILDELPLECDQPVSRCPAFVNPRKDLDQRGGRCLIFAP